MKLHLFKIPFYGIEVVSYKLTGLFTLRQKNSITIFPFIFYKTIFQKKNLIVRNTRLISLQQQMECGLAGIFMLIFIDLVNFSIHSNFVLIQIWFLILPVLLYPVLYYLNRSYTYIQYKNKRYSLYYKEYKTIFDREIYNNANNSYYYKYRKSFSWIKYLTY